MDMNFENLSEMVRMHQYEEVKIIGRDVCTHGKNYHFAAMVRNGDAMQVYVLEQVARFLRPLLLSIS